LVWLPTNTSLLQRSQISLFNFKRS
jgi:hypothetical protein